MPIVQCTLFTVVNNESYPVSIGYTQCDDFSSTVVTVSGGATVQLCSDPAGDDPAQVAGSGASLTITEGNLCTTEDVLIHLNDQDISDSYLLKLYFLTNH